MARKVQGAAIQKGEGQAIVLVVRFHTHSNSEVITWNSLKDSPHALLAWRQATLLGPGFDPPGRSQGVEPLDLMHNLFKKKISGIILQQTNTHT